MFCLCESVKEALVITHSKLSLKISEGLKCNTDNDYQRGSTKGEDAAETGCLAVKLILDAVKLRSIGCIFVPACGDATLEDSLEKRPDEVGSCNKRNNRDNAEEERTCKSDLVEDLSDVISRRTALSDTGDRTSVHLQIVSNLDGVEGNLSVEVCKRDNQNKEYDRIYDAIASDYLREGAPEALGLGAYAAESENGGNERHDRACKDNGHNAGHIELDGKVRALSAVHLTSYVLLRILNRNSSLGAGDVYYEDDRCDKQCDERKSKYDRANDVSNGLLIGEGRYYKLYKVVHLRRKRGYNVCEKYDRDTVTDAALVDSVSEPHDKRCACNVAGDDHDRVEPVHLTAGSGVGEHACSLEQEVVSDSGNYRKNYRHDPGYKAHLLLIVLRESSDGVREDDAEKLEYY